MTSCSSEVKMTSNSTSEAVPVQNQERDNSRSPERKKDSDQSPFSCSPLKSPIVIFNTGKQNIHNDAARLLLQCNPTNLSSIYAFAQASLVQQTQQDIMKMFSPDYFDQQSSKNVQVIDLSIKREKAFDKKNDPDSKTKQESNICEFKGCGRSFASVGHLKNHQLMHEREKALECHYEDCGRKFTWPAHLKYHLLTHEKTRTYQCPVESCQKAFVTGQQLKVHSRTHTGERPFKCDQCEKAFTTAGNLKNHVRTHTGDKPYKCPEPKCNLRFAEYSSLKKHSLIHSGEKPFKCQVCNKSFTQSGSMRVHMKKHSQQDSSIEKKPEYNVVMMEESSSSGNIDYQLVFADSETDSNIITVTTEQPSNSITNEMIVMEEITNTVPSNIITQEDCCTANVVVLPLPQLPVTMETNFHTQTYVSEEIVLDENGFLYSEFDHEETAGS